MTFFVSQIRWKFI